MMRLCFFSDRWSVVSGQWSVVSCQSSVVSCQLSVVSCQLSVVSCQLSVVKKISPLPLCPSAPLPLASKLVRGWFQDSITVEVNAIVGDPHSCVFFNLFE